MFSDREAKIVAKSTKMLVHYLHHFGEVRNVMFQVQMRKPMSAQGDEWNVILSIFPARTDYFDHETNEKRKIHNDVSKLATLVELCPDLVAVDKITDKFGNISYSIESINYELNFIRSDFFKQ